MNEPISRLDRRLTRRRLLAVSGSALAVVSTAACDILSTKRRNDGAAASGPKGSEAPMLADMVKAGKLPSVQKRLPAEPLVLQPTDSIGSYGGTWNSWYPGPSGTYIIANQIRYENLVRWNVPWTKVEPNIAKSWEVNDGAHEFVFHLRKGMKWSDGAPFTADDVVFGYDDALLNTDLSPVASPIFTLENKPASLEKVDDYTIKFTFHKPSGMFLEYLCTVGGNALFIPRHYMEQFHQKYAEDIEAITKEHQAESWVDLFWNRNDPLVNADRPVLDPWVAVRPPGDGTSRAEYVRNPYYWKTDPEGSQLPYLDRVVYPVISDINTVLLKTTSGEIDLNFPRAAASPCTPANKPVLAESRDKGGYQLVDASTGLNNEMVIAFNLAHSDKDKRRVFQNKDFRIGMSYAINRPELIKVAFQRQGEPFQAAPAKDSGAYHERLAKQYTEYDVDKANEHLDRAGLTERDDSGFRVGPGGKRVSFTMDVATEEPDQISALEVIKQNWEDVGVEMQIKAVERTLFYTRKEANKHDANVWTGAGALRSGIYLSLRWYLPAEPESNFGIPWSVWYTSRGTAGEEPPGAAKQQFQLLDEIKTSPDEKTRHKLLMQILDIAADEFWVIGIVSSVGVYATVRNDFKNVPELIGAWEYANEGPASPAQFYRDNVG